MNPVKPPPIMLSNRAYRCDEKDKFKTDLAQLVEAFNMVPNLPEHFEAGKGALRIIIAYERDE
jgi:hypothetical protein